MSRLATRQRGLGDAKSGKDEASGLAKWGSERGRHWVGGLQTKGAGGKRKEVRRQGRVKGMRDREKKSRVQERDVGEGGLYLCGARGGAVRGRESDRAPYPIGKDAVSGCSDSVFYIIKFTDKTTKLETRFLENRTS